MREKYRMRRFLLLLIFCLPCLMGTTYILKEKGVETGRMIEKDGKDVVKVIEGGIENSEDSENKNAPGQAVAATSTMTTSETENMTAETVSEPSIAALMPDPSMQIPIQPNISLPAADSASVTPSAGRVPDKIETVKTADGKEVIKITGQMPESFYEAHRTQKLAELERLRLARADRYLEIRIPNTRYDSMESETPPFTHRVLSDNFVIEIEDNEILGQRTAQLLEAFYTLFRKEVPGLTDRPDNREKLKVKIFKGRPNYENYCKDNQLECDHTLGIAAFGVTKDAKKGFLYTNTVVFYWDEKGERNYFKVLFHEVTHQLLTIHTQRKFPKWLTEGLAVYFGNVRFDDNDIYLPRALINPYVDTMKIFLSNQGDPKVIFTWEKYDKNELAYYGLSGSLVFFLMRREPYKHFIEDLMTQLRNDLPADKLGEYLASQAPAEFWKDWYRTFSDYTPLPGTKLFYFE